MKPVNTRKLVNAIEEQIVVGDDHIVLAMAQSFPYNADDSEYLRTVGPDALAGRTAGTVARATLVDPDSADELLLQIWFMAFETEDLASEFLVAQLTPPYPATVIEEVFTFEGLGDEALGTFVTNRGRGGGSSERVTIRRGRFVAQVWVNPREAEGQTVERARAFAEVADETVRLVLSSDVQPLEALPEDLTSYRIRVEANGATLERIVTPQDHGCIFGGIGDDGLSRGIAELSGEAWERVTGNWDWFRSESDSPRFLAGRDHCQAWTPDLSQTYLADLIETAEGHAGVQQGRPTTSYWFTKVDLVAAGVLASTDDVTIDEFEVVVDDAGPWLMELRMSVLANDDEALAKLILLDPQGFEKVEENLVVYNLVVESSNDTAALVDDLYEMVQPRPGG